jgi:hypothetical protein
MPTTHTGSAAGITDADPIDVSNPNDGEDLTAASNSTATNKLADFIAWVKTAFAKLAGNQTWTGINTYSVDVIWPGRTITGAASLGSNWSAASNADSPAGGWYKDAAGHTCLTGILTHTGGSPAAVAFVLPSGVRPAGLTGAQSLIFPVLYNGASYALGMCAVKADGSVYLTPASGAYNGGGGIFYLDGVRFRVS